MESQFNAGHAKGKADCRRGHYIEPTAQDGYEWSEGYESGWAAAFFARENVKNFTPNNKD